mmetsp:Transcript_3248/g.4964  ORF Transcript_3248/g.4964 Transcript_3248/m.4964 type:complete len:84 (-) Transcript_3248:3147-3398(-)
MGDRRTVAQGQHGNSSRISELEDLVGIKAEARLPKIINQHSLWGVIDYLLQGLKDLPSIATQKTQMQLMVDTHGVPNDVSNDS